MKTIEQDAARLAVLFDLGMVDAQEVINWADNAIISAGKPSYELIELSVSSPSNISKSLRSLSLGADVWTGISDALPFILKVLEEKPELARVVAREFYRLAVAENYSVPERYSFFVRADDDFDLAEAGVFVFGEVYRRFIDNIRRAVT